MAFQQDAYRPLQWPSLGGGGVCLGEVSALGKYLPRGVCARGGVVCLGGPHTPWGKNDKKV